MEFKNHFNLEGKHAPFSASSPYWLKYDDEKLINTYSNMKRKELGTQLHEWAKTTIDLGIKQPRSSKNTLYAYVNDAIGYKMSTEVVLFYSENFFGTADSISFRNNFLRIHDLKTGSTAVHVEQLYIYAALFCLEYNVDPYKIQIELRIYQNPEVQVYTPDPKDIRGIMDSIVHYDTVITKYNRKEV